MAESEPELSSEDDVDIETAELQKQYGHVLNSINFDVDYVFNNHKYSDYKVELECRMSLNEPEEESDRKKQIAQLAQMITELPYLHARTDTWSLICFLRACKWNNERALKKIKNYYEMRSKIPAWFQGRDPYAKPVIDMLNLGVFVPLTKQDKYERTVVLIRPAVHDPRLNSMSDVFKVGKMLMDLLLDKDPMLSIFGVVALIDLQGVSFRHALEMKPDLIKKAVNAWQNCYPVRVKLLCFIRAPFHVNVVLKIFRQFMSEKLRQRVNVYYGTDLKIVHKTISPNILPEEYGGTCGKLQNYIKFWTGFAKHHRDWFIENEKLRADFTQKKEE